MPLQNRVDPFGNLCAVSARGTLMGNRGGRLHDDRRGLGNRRWVSRQWICCKLDFNNRHRKIWGNSYTELFFLDEVTAFAAGHRPCFECRRKDALAFAERFPGAQRAPAIDKILHAERLDGEAKRLHRRKIAELPDGTTVVIDGGPFVLRGQHLLRWTPQGYTDKRPRARGRQIDVLTPPSILAVLSRGYRPSWHPSAG
jgi:hypothetical protein